MASLLAEARKRAGLTQAQAAEKLNVTQTAISQWEKGTTHPEFDKIPRIAAAYGCKIADLFGEEAS